jgi:hypothetical protein
MKAGCGKVDEGTSIKPGDRIRGLPLDGRR